jgi:hypothetical protein
MDSNTSTTIDYSSILKGDDSMSLSDVGQATKRFPICSGNTSIQVIYHVSICEVFHANQKEMFIPQILFLIPISQNLEI